MAGFARGFRLNRCRHKKKSRKKPNKPKKPKP